MKNLKLIVFLFTLSCFYSQKLLINEVSQGTSGNKEFVEFIVNTAFPGQCPDINECVDLRLWIIDDNNAYFSNGNTVSVGFALGAVRFSNNAFWSCIKPGTLITIYDDTDSDPIMPPVDVSVNDGNCSLVIPISSNLFEKHLTLPDPNGSFAYPTTGWVSGGLWSLIAMQNSNDSFQVLDPQNTTIPAHAVSYGNNTFNNIIYFSGSASGLTYQCTNAISNNFSDQNNWSSLNAISQSPGVFNSPENQLFANSINAVCRTQLNASVTFLDDVCGGVCDGSAQVDQVTGGVPNYSYLWSNNQIGSNISNICAGNYSLTVTDEANCQFVVNFTIQGGNTQAIQVSPDVTICEGSTITLTANGPADVIWQNIGTQGLSVNVSPTQTTTYTAYDVQANSCFTPSDVTVTVSSLPEINLGNDFVSCDGSPCNVNIANTYDYLLWDDGSNSYSRTFSQNGTYHVTAWSNTVNIIENGDFSGGTTAAQNNFSTAYSQGVLGPFGLLTDAGTYAISTSPSLVHYNFLNCGDHTTGNGNMLICNGSSNLNTPVWCQTVAVQPNTDYSFSCWAMNVINNIEVSNLQFFINGVQLGDVFQTDVNGCIWQEFFSLWNSGNNNSAQLCIYNQNIIDGGNDFAIDDIYFSPICSKSDEINVHIENFSVQVGNDQIICPGDDVQLQGVINESNNYEVVTFSNNTDFPIFDNFSINSVISVSGINYSGASSPIASVCVNINHSYDADLDISLICPDGTQIDLSSDNGGSDNNYTNTCFDELSANITTGSAPFTGAYSPEQSFSLLNSCTINGNWKLKVADDGSGDTGTLLDWSISFKNDLPNTNFTWTPNTDIINSNTLSPTVNPSNSTTYTLTSTSVSGYCTASDDIIINVQSGGDASFSYNQSSYCQSENNPSPNILNAGGVFSSSPAGLVFLNGVGTIDLANSVTGDYTITYSLGTSCNSSHDENVSIANNPFVNSVNDVTQCAGTTLSQIQFSGSSGTTFQWVNDNTSIGIPSNGDNSISSIDLVNNGNSTESSIITITPVAGACTGQQISFNINVNPLPSINAGADISVCENEQVTLNATSNFSVSWDNNVVNNSPFIPSQTTTYTASVTDANLCANSDQITVTVNSLPTVSMPNDTSFCLNTPNYTFVASPIGGTWSGTGINSNGLFNNSIPTPEQNNIITYTFTDANSCISSQNMNIIVHNLPNVNAGQDINICFGALVTLNASGAVSYQWDNGITNGVSFTAYDGIFTVIGIDANSCQNTDQVEINVGDFVLIPISDIIGCVGETVTVQTGNAQQYLWQPTNLLTENGDIANITIQQNATISVIGYNNSCVDTIQFQITALPTPFVNAGEDKIVCIGDSIQLIAQGNADSYIWNNDIIDSSFVLPTQNEVYQLTGTIGTCSSIDFFNITTAEKPILINNTDTLKSCTPATVNFDITVSPNSNISWSFGDGTFSNIEDPVHVYHYEGIPNIIVNATNEYCYNEITLDSLIFLYNIPIAKFGVDKEELSNTNSEVNFTNFSYFADTYEWNFGDSSTSNEINPKHNYNLQNDNNIVVQLIAWNENVCSDTALMIIDVFPDQLLFVPNSFTPDGDEFNNIFRPQISGIKENSYHLIIFNRWGEIIFESFDLNVGWDGTFNVGGICKSDIYVWKIEYETIKGNLEFKTGNVNLLR